jgi:F-type H+-transporting ATPase subunit a
VDNLFHEPAKFSIELFNKVITLNVDMLVMTWLVMVIIIVLAILATKKLTTIPGKIQNIFELFIESFKDMVVSTIGEDGHKYVPLISTIFIFVLISNWIGIFPKIFTFIGMVIALILKIFGLTAANIEVHSFFNVGFMPPMNEWYSFFFKIPEFSEPTRYLSTDLALGFIVAVVVHGAAIKEKGIAGYFKSYAEPMWFLYPLNIISEIAKVISHSFRLFGNVLGGSIIIIIVSKLVFQIGLPVMLNVFFGLFVGAIQAFVFAMLAVTYIAIASK